MAKINKKRFLINSLLAVAISSAPVILIACSQVSDPVDLPPKNVQDPVKVDAPKAPDDSKPFKKDDQPKDNNKGEPDKQVDISKIDKKDDQTNAGDGTKNIKKDKPGDSPSKTEGSSSTTTKTEEPKKDNNSKQEPKSGSTSEPKTNPNKPKDEPVTQIPKAPENPQKPLFPEQNSITFTIKNKVLPSEINNSNFDANLTNSIDTSEFTMSNLRIINFDDSKGEIEFAFKLQDKKTKEFSTTEYNFKVSGFKTILEDLDSREVVFSPKNSSLKPSQVTVENFNENINILGLKSGDTFVLDKSFNFEKDDQKGTLKFKHKLQKDNISSSLKEVIISLSALTQFNPDISFTQESKKTLVEAKKYASEVTIADLQKYLKWSDVSSINNDSKASELIFSDLSPDNAKHQLSFRYLVKNKYGQSTTIKKVVYVKNFKDVDEFLSSKSSVVTVSLTDLAKTKTQTEITSDLRNYNKYFKFSFKSKDINLIANPFAISKSSDGKYMLGYNLYLQSDRNIRKRLFLKFEGLKEEATNQDTNNTHKLAPTIASIKKFDSDNMYNFFKIAQSDEAQQNLTASIDISRTGEERTQFEFVKDRTIALHVNYQDKDVWHSLGGTGWLIGKASNSTDWTDPDFYSYYVATNLHVYTAFLERKLEHPESTYSWSTFKQYGNKDEFMRRLNSKGNWDDTQTALTGADYNYSSEVDFIYAAQGLQAKVNSHSKNGETLTTIKTFDEYEKTKEVEQKLGVDFAVMKINLLSAKQKELLSKVTDKTDSRKWIKQLKDQALTASSGDTEKYRLWNVRFIETLTSNTPTSFKDLSFAVTTFNPDENGYDKTSEDLKLTGLIGTFPATVVPNIGNTNTEKYQLYSGEHNEKIGSGFILAKINKIDFMVQFNGLKNVDSKDPLEVVGSLDVYEKNGADTKEKSAKHSHISVSKSVRFLNVGGGSSGSVLFSKNDNSVLGIYRGVSLQTKDRSKWPPNSKIFGQIVQLRVKGYYDVIGGKTPLENTPANHTLYDAIKKLNSEKGGDKKYRIPDFK
ncbi:hypothetical protein CJJ23_04745 [Mycoplasmopsis agassizii]|uniref:Lipoprotein n=1 Tax=Mycoplasmopsis agassizii TaxID=33922 RepID=A0A269THN6_9BACT|nr:lipoprotein 17-related variable surface protein [Mycoplasmopsis agassizii]PAK20907.1 hypothetical protein CJJ23_04745 [Mycoplasmopsis agassizii]